MKKIIITGIAGQDGRILSNKIDKKKFKVIGFSNCKVKKINNCKNYNIKNRSLGTIKKLLFNIKPDIILHLGSANPSFNKKFKKIDYDNNVSFSKLLINFSSENKSKFIFASSSMIYKKTSKKIKENSRIQISDYYSKFRINISDYLLKNKKKNKLNCTIIILFNHDSKFRNKRFLLPRLIKSIKERDLNFIKKIYKNNINGDFSHAEDICEAIYLLIKKDLNPDKIILSSGKRTFINDIIDYYLPDLKLKKIKTLYNESIIGNNSKAKKILNWRPKKTHMDATKELFKIF